MMKKVKFQVVTNEEIEYFMPKGFGALIDNDVELKRKALAKSLNDKANSFWTGHTMFYTLVNMGLLNDNLPCKKAKPTARGYLYLKQEGFNCEAPN